MNEYILQVKNLQAGYYNLPVLQNLSFAMRQGDKCILTGSNGTGKTTLLKTLLGLHLASGGEIRLFGLPVPACRKPAVRRRCAYIHQHTISAQLPVSVREMAAMGLTGLHLPQHKAYSRVMDALEKTGMQQLVKKPYNELSGGQKQRVQIARCLVQGARLLFLDEPLSSLDPESKKGISELLSGLEQTVLVISHEHAYFIRHNWIFYALKDGGLV